MWGKGTLIHCWWDASWCNYSGKKNLRLLTNLNIDLPYDPAIPLLSI
jgi:hypothetical protein